MKFPAMAHGDILAAIASAPPPGPLAPRLAGWVTDDQRAYCARCVGRLIARGFAGAMGSGAVPAWTPAALRCLACGHETGGESGQGGGS